MGDHNGIFNSHNPFTRKYHFGFHGNDHPFFKTRLRPFPDDGPLVQVQTDAMAHKGDPVGAAHKSLAEARLFHHFQSRPVEIIGLCAGNPEPQKRLLNFQHHLMGVNERRLQVSKGKNTG